MNHKSNKNKSPHIDDFPARKEVKPIKSIDLMSHPDRVDLHTKSGFTTSLLKVRGGWLAICATGTTSFIEDPVHQMFDPEE